METTIATPVVESQPAEEASPQATEQTAQATPQPQETTDTKVESTTQATSDEQARPKPQPSSFYAKRREENRLKQELSDVRKQMQEMASLIRQQQKPSAPKPELPEWMRDPQRFWESPQENLFRLRQEAVADAKKEAMEEFQRMLPNALQEYRTHEDKERKMQEAVEMIFPNKSNANEPLDVRVKADPERYERMQQIIVDYDLAKLSETNPTKAAELALMIERQQSQAKAAPRPAPNPNVIKKSLVGPTATGNKLTGGEKPMPTLRDIRAEKEKLEKMVEDNPELRFDDSFKAQWNAVKQQYVALNKEQRGDQTK